MKAIKINGDDGRVLSIGLKDVLSCIVQGEKANWGVLWLEATADLGDDQSIVDLGNRFNSSEAPRVVSWVELLKLSTQVIQSINLLIIGDKKALSIRRYSMDEQMYKNCDYTIELIDSSYWIIHSNDDVFIENAFDRLQGVDYYDL